MEYNSGEMNYLTKLLALKPKLIQVPAYGCVVPQYEL